MCKLRISALATRTRLTLTVLALALALAAFAQVTPPANASPAVNWDAIAACESGGNWHIATGNGYSGGLQWAPGTWAANRAPGDPVRASEASREQQIAAAERLRAHAGLSPWPVCGRLG